MSTPTTSDTVGRMTEQQGRGAAIAERRKKQGLSVRRIAKFAKMDPGTWSDLEADDPKVQELTFARAEKALDDWTHETTSEAEQVEQTAETEQHLVKFRISGDFGVEVVVEGPVSDLEALEASAMRIRRNIGRGQED